MTLASSHAAFSGVVSCVRDPPQACDRPRRVWHRGRYTVSSPAGCLAALRAGASSAGECGGHRLPSERRSHHRLLACSGAAPRLVTSLVPLKRSELLPFRLLLTFTIIPYLGQSRQIATTRTPSGAGGARCRPPATSRRRGS